MALRKKKLEEQQELWVATADIAKTPRHVFYDRLNKLLAEAGFDSFVEELVEPYYADGGRPGIAPGVYFRMLFIGYFEGIDSQRGIAWRCEDSLSLRKFLGLRVDESTPDEQLRSDSGLECESVNCDQALIRPPAAPETFAAKGCLRTATRCLAANQCLRNSQ